MYFIGLILSIRTSCLTLLAKKHRNLTNSSSFGIDMPVLFVFVFRKVFFSKIVFYSIKRNNNCDALKFLYLQTISLQLIAFFDSACYTVGLPIIFVCTKSIALACLINKSLYIASWKM